MKKRFVPKLAGGGSPGTSDEKPKLDISTLMDALSLITDNTAGGNGTADTDIAEDQTAVQAGPSTGSMVAGGAAKGISAGAKFGPWGAAAGAVLGTVGGLIGGNKVRKAEERQQKQLESKTKAKFQKLNLTSNIDPYGTDNTFYMEEGGFFGEGDPGPKSIAHGKVTNKARRELMKTRVANPYGKYNGIGTETVTDDNPTELEAILNNVEFMKNNWWDSSNNYRPENYHIAENDTTVQKQLTAVPMAEDGMAVTDETAPEADQKKRVNIEKGELLVDPSSLDIIREFTNPNRYRPHVNNPQFEPIGNFVGIDEGTIIVSKKYAKRYKDGDALARKSILMEILKNQRLNPTPVTAIPQAEDGMYVGPGPRDASKKKLIIPMVEFDKEGNILPAWHADPAFQEGLNPDNPASDVIVGGTGSAVTAADAEPAKDRTGGAAAGKKGNKILTPTNVARALNFVPTAFGIASKMRDENVVYDENQQIDRAKSIIGGMETNPSIEASRGNIRRTVANMNRFSNNVNSPSVRAEVASRAGDIISAEGQLIQNATNLSMEGRNKKRGALAELEVSQGADRLTGRRIMRDTLAQNAAAKSKMIQAGLSEASRNFGAQVMDDNKLHALNSMLEFNEVGNDGKMKDTKQFSQAVLDMLASTTGMSAEEMQLAFRREEVKRDKVGQVKGSSTVKKYVPKIKK